LGRLFEEGQKEETSSLVPLLQQVFGVVEEQMPGSAFCFCVADKLFEVVLLLLKKKRRKKKEEKANQKKNAKKRKKKKKDEKEKKRKEEEEEEERGVREAEGERGNEEEMRVVVVAEVEGLK
jgi:mannitol-specific phosphotransferase system IIBC component